MVMAANRSVTRTAVPKFGSAEEVERSYAMRRELRGLDGLSGSAAAKGPMPELYPRDGFRALTELESRISEIAGVSKESLLAYPAGMSSVVAAAESAHPTQGTTLLLGKEHYTETPRYVDEHLRPRGVKVVRADSGNARELDAAIRKHDPDIILLETVSNGVSMPVVDIPALFASIKASGKSPLVILDNTLPTSTILAPGALLGDGSVTVAVVESGTKAYARNSEMLGILYTNNNELYTSLYSARITVGYTPTPSAVETITSSLPDSKEDFDRRNRAVFANTLTLARALEQVSGQVSGLTVTHPNLSGHQNKQLSDSLNPDGVSPVFYINNGKDQFELTDLLMQDGTVRELCEIGQSFGFDKTRIYPYYGNPFVRIAGGASHSSDEVGELANALASALKRA